PRCPSRKFPVRRTVAPAPPPRAAGRPCRRPGAPAGAGAARPGRPPREGRPRLRLPPPSARRWPWTLGGRMVHLASLVTTAADNPRGRRSGWRALGRLLPYARPHLGRLLLAGMAMAVLALATGLYAFLVGPALRFLLTGGASALGRVASWAPALEAAGRGGLVLAPPLVPGALAGGEGAAAPGPVPRAAPCRPPA